MKCVKRFAPSWHIKRLDRPRYSYRWIESDTSIFVSPITWPRARFGNNELSGTHLTYRKSSEWPNSSPVWSLGAVYRFVLLCGVRRWTPYIRNPSSRATKTYCRISVDDRMMVVRHGRIDAGQKILKKRGTSFSKFSRMKINPRYFNTTLGYSGAKTTSISVTGFNLDDDKQDHRIYRIFRPLSASRPDATYPHHAHEQRSHWHRVFPHSHSDYVSQFRDSSFISQFIIHETCFSTQSYRHRIFEWRFDLRLLQEDVAPTSSPQHSLESRNPFPQYHSSDEPVDRHSKLNELLLFV